MNFAVVFRVNDGKYQSIFLTLIFANSPRWQGSTDRVNGDEHAHNVHAKRFFACMKLLARKSIKTSLSIFKYYTDSVQGNELFLCLKASIIRHNKIWYSQFLSVEELLLNIVISSVM